MKTLIVLIMTIATQISFAESPVIPQLENPIEAANLMMQKSVRNCMDEVEKGGLLTLVDSIEHYQYEDATQFLVSGMLLSGDIIEGSWTIIVTKSYMGFPFGLPVYSCEVDSVDQLNK